MKKMEKIEKKKLSKEYVLRIISTLNNICFLIIRAHQVYYIMNENGCRSRNIIVKF